MFLQTKAIWSLQNCSFKTSLINFLALAHTVFTSFKFLPFCEFAILEKRKIIRGKFESQETAKIKCNFFSPGILMEISLVITIK